ncbi:cyclic AMP-responsive element-binding protein 3-like protein 4 isoform X1 [Hippocampus zosterae]|uniref:cyclic AMP-responsive element-binding protein 3-like protein 4 isoform X1 n=1 Tax=Hippocampus zosterae TaxID=109293 RepID=UPI00223DB20D|nr:cyclic AMP-responsive element-binding protein 3-like protein 4 isoform X1 [Hippocampus zosterae]XP_051920864.1 cyclic AMP-responsive element-binding protein 3-like protein 4 isoform X1 [Hippocampus zosterae]
MDAENARIHGDTASLSCQQEVALTLSERRPLDPMLSDSESEDVLHAVDPNDVFGGGGPSSGNEDLIPPRPVYQLVYDLSSEEGEPAGVDVIAIQLEPWNSHHFLSDACVVGELPLGQEHFGVPADQEVKASGTLHLTAEEEKLLSQEGVSLPDKLPLTKAEERVLKKVRRKIRNKQSAQDSRRRRKEYIDGLEDRAALCSAQNKDLQKKVEQLEKHNMSLLTQLRHLQSLVKHSVSKGAQTSTCLLIIFISLSLIMLPSLSPFSRRLSADDDDRPTGVLSRNILTDFASSLTPSDETLPSDSSVPSDVSQSGVDVQEAGQNLEGVPSNNTVLQGVQSGNSSSESPAQLAAKLPHADEM